LASAAPIQVDPIIAAADLELSAADVAEIEDAAGRRRMTTIGFVGLGAMGGRVAGRLLASGHPLVGWNRTRGKAEPLINLGLSWRDTPREVAETAEIVFSMVTHDAALEAIAGGPDGLLAGLAAGKIRVDMSTVSPERAAHWPSAPARSRRRCSTHPSPAASTRPRAER
jgi:prephenate dehydrogenase